MIMTPFPPLLPVPCGSPAPDLVFSHLLGRSFVLLQRVFSPLRPLCVTHSFAVNVLLEAPITENEQNHHTGLNRV